jgi:acyl transferase domain-containing protein
MAVALAEESPVFAEALRACGEALAPYVDWRLEDVLGDAAAFERVEILQPALWAVMVSLAAMWRSVGVVPDVVVGHSQGEIAAATVAGCLSLDDAARVAALRSRALGDALAGRGGMVSVQATEEDVATLLGRCEGVAVAAVNAPRSVVVAGDPAALDALMELCEHEDVRARRIAVDYASHTPQVEAIEERVREELAPIAPVAGDVAFCSAVRGGEIVDGRELGPDYWYRSMRDPVAFQQATQALLADGVRTFVELTPHPVLELALEQTAEAAGVETIVARSLRRDEGGPRAFVRSAPTPTRRGRSRSRRDAPAPSGGAARLRVRARALRLEPARGRGRASVLGSSVAVAGRDEHVFSGRLSAARCRGWATTPCSDRDRAGTAFVEIALHAWRARRGASCWRS